MEKHNIQTGNDSAIFLQKHSVILRIWHWLTFLFVTASMITVLFASTILHPWDNIGLVQKELQEKGATVTHDQAFAVSHAFEDKMWDIHKLIGFGLVFLLLARILIEFIQPADEKLRYRLNTAIDLSNKKNANKNEFLHYVRVKRSYFLFFLLLFLMAISGIALAFGHELNIARPTYHLIKIIHSICQYFMYAFVFFHFCGVILAENNRAKGIVSGMIHGGK